jgi:hypothetical protein
VTLVVLVTAMMPATIFSSSSILSVEVDGKNAMSWVETSIPHPCTFLVLTNTSNVMEDATKEWFPAITGCQSITTVQGSEWKGDSFKKINTLNEDIQACLDSIDCINNQIKNSNEDYHYIYVSRIMEQDLQVGVATLLYRNLLANENYALRYDDSISEAVFEKIK